MSLEPTTIRMALDLARRSQPKDVYTKQSPKLSAGSATLLQLAIYSRDELLTDISNIATVTVSVVELRKNGKGPALDATPVILEADATLDGTLDAASWADYSKQHIELELTAAQTNVPDGRYWLSVQATTNDNPSKSIDLGFGFIDVLDTGFTAGPSPSLEEPYYNAAQIDQLLAAISVGGFRYEHTQGSAATQWNVGHNLGLRPNVHILDTSGDMIVADVAHVDSNNLTITLVAATAGRVICS